MNQRRSIGWKKYPEEKIKSRKELVEEDDIPVSFEELEDEGRIEKLLNTKLMRTPQGLYRVKEDIDIDSVFDFWIGHTRGFKISEYIRDEIEACDGVETIDIITPYRFRIAVGQMYSFDEVRQEIESVVLGEDYVSDGKEVVDNDTAKRIKLVSRELREHAKYWAGYVLPNGKITTINSNRLDASFQENFDNLKQAKAGVGGIIFSYLDQNEIPQINSET